MATTHDVATIHSRVNDKYLALLLRYFPRLAGFDPIIPATNARACSPPLGKVAVYGHSFFNFCLRLPFTPFFLEVCKFYGVAVGQFEPAAIRKILIFEMYCHASNIVPSIRIFCSLVRIASYEKGWFTFNKVNGFLRPALDHPSYDWHASFIFINEDSIDNKYSSVRVWRQYIHPVSVTFPRLNNKENALLKKLKSEKINHVKYGEHMLSLTFVSQDWDITQGYACVLAGRKKITPLTAMRSSSYSQLNFTTQKIVDDTPIPEKDGAREEEEEEEEEVDIGMNRIASRERRASGNENDSTELCKILDQNLNLFSFRPSTGGFYNPNPSLYIMPPLRSCERYWNSFISNNFPLSPTATASHQGTTLVTLPPSAKRRRTGQNALPSAQQEADTSSSQKQIMLPNLYTNILSSFLKGPPLSYEDFMNFLNAMVCPSLAQFFSSLSDADAKKVKAQSIILNIASGLNDLQRLSELQSNEITTNKELSAEKEKITKLEQVATSLKRNYDTMKRHYENCNTQRAEYSKQVKELSFRENQHLSRIEELVKENNALKE
ncbi:uncharacterized protein [Rutidosis leptorrhynchoides]|uniref:uncharacterized protein isoform X1 n=1 Tax=Rutidosis leptorrhynchoides TaxID=125765 RepID=UPI003A98EAAC